VPSLSPQEEAEREASRKALAARIDAYVKNDPAWQKSKLGIYVATADRKKMVYSRNGNAPMIPASNLKVVTSAVALETLGPDYKFETSLWGGQIDPRTGVMEGSLYLRGTGDPTFMEPFTGSPTEVLHDFARILKKRGVKVIEGDLVGDDWAFDREYLGRGWKERYLMCDYAAPAGALSINGNCLNVVVAGDSVSMEPGNKYIQVIREPGTGGVSVTRRPGTDRVYVRGSSAGTTYSSMTINDPSRFSTATFAHILKIHGIGIRGKVRLVEEKDRGYDTRCQKLTSHDSPPLHKIVRLLNKESDNICAQHVFKAISHVVKGQGTCDNSNDVIKEFMKNAGIDTSAFSMADGSGLSVYNRITPRQMCELLAAMTTGKSWKHFWASLPIAGTDGTLQYRMQGYPVRAKTGSLQGHIALSGYAKTKAGQMVVFSIMTNQHRSGNDRIRMNEDEVAKMIAGWDRKL
jgi:D-alanyl-D-alanine carboxypeptidase/D-alanyl-D-alanine-endopeptidase (penicillin-binding protein 4)